MHQRTSLYAIAERVQGDMAWGAVLDAGTGVQSARWIAGLATSRWTAVSADPEHLAEVRSAVGAAMRPQDRLIAGNWTDPALLSGDVHDVVIADYLLGAIEGYAPYFQAGLFARLRPLVGRRLFVIGVDPYIFAEAEDDAGRLVKEIGRFRDACALLAGVLPYREFPAEWVVDRLRQAGYRLIYADRFPTGYDSDWIDRQFKDCRHLIQRVENKRLVEALVAAAATLHERAVDICGSRGGLKHGHEYVIAAEPD